MFREADGAADFMAGLVWQFEDWEVAQRILINLVVAYWLFCTRAR